MGGCSTSNNQNIDLGIIRVGSTRRFKFTFKKDGVLWSGIDSILLTFYRPDRSTSFQRSMTLLDDSAGIWYYDTTITDLDTVGYWGLETQVTDGDIIDSYPYDIGFKVIN